MPPADEPAPETCLRCGTSLPGQGGHAACAVCLFDAALSITAAPDGETGAADWLADDAEAAASAGQPLRFGAYELLGEIARGGMGVVYRARQHRPNRLVALKVLLPRKAAATGTLARFRAEAAMVASLDHPHLLPIYEAGERDGLPFFSMKLVEGGSLAGRIREYAGRYRAAAQLVRQAAGAVHHAHQRGILHRDLKPGNILLHGEGEGEGEPAPFVADFGIAKFLDRENELTLTHDVLGTPAYAAPEQASPGWADMTTAVDVYGLGTVLYELLTQRPPFAGTTALETLRKVMDEPLLPPRLCDPAIPRDLETICLKCLQKDPRARYASAAALAADLERFLAGDTVLARPVTAGERVWRWVRRNPALAALWTVLALFVLTVAVGSTAAAWRLGTEKRRAVSAENKAIQARNEAVENLRSSYRVGAHALLGNALAGHRVQALASLKQAAAIRPGFDLRNEAIAALALTDVTLEKRWTDVKASIYGPLAFDPTFQFCASVIPGQKASIWKFADRQTVCLLPAEDADKSRAYQLGPWNGAHLPLITALGSVRVYRTDSAGQARLTFSLPYRFPNADVSTSFGRIALSPDGLALAVRAQEENGGLFLLDPDNGHELRHLAVGHPVDLVAFNADGSRLVFAKEFSRDAHRWNIAEDREEKVYPVGGDIISMALSVADQFVALGTNQVSVDLLAYDSGEVLHKLQTAPNRLAFSPHGDLLASTGRDLALKLWQARTGELLVNAPGFSAEPALRFSADAQRIAISPYTDRVAGTVRLLGNDCRRVVFPAQRANGGYDFNSLAVSPDGRLFAAATRYGVALGDLHAGQQLAWWPLDPDGRNRLTLQFTADGSGLVVCSEKSGRWHRALTWDGPSHLAWGPPRLLDGSPGWMLTSKTTPGNVGAFLRLDACEVSIQPVDAAGTPGGPKAALTGDTKAEGRWWQAALTRDGRYLATATESYLGATDQACKVWDTATWKVVHRGPVDGGSLAFSPSGKYYYSNAPPATVWETGRWQAVFQLPYSTDAGNFSPDDRLLAVRDDSPHDNNPGVIRLFALPSGEPLAVFETGGDQTVFSPDGRYFIIGATGALAEIWDLHAVRRELRKIGLDWSNEPIPDDGPPPPPLTVRDEP